MARVALDAVDTWLERDGRVVTGRPRSLWVGDARTAGPEDVVGLLGVPSALTPRRR